MNLLVLKALKTSKTMFCNGREIKRFFAFNQHSGKKDFDFMHNIAVINPLYVAVNAL